MGGLCPRCLLSLALLPPVHEPTADWAPDGPSLDSPAAGQIRGERYQMRELLGRGGMGEVWRAFDLKLRVEVALKSVRSELLSSERAHELLRQEVRAARSVVSPNVCRVFDLVVDDGREFVSMEYIDGETLTGTLWERGPLQLQEAREIASQFLSGLDAIHQAGLVHRDLKPGNLMLTRAGRVVVMDFGLAKGLGEPRAGSISGTPAYMSPEQARGEEVDARADVYAAGVVLAEMLSLGSGGGIAAREALYEGVRRTPPRVPEGPWAGVLRQCLNPRPDGRPATARALARALEEVTLRLPGFEEERPYPGLASFAEGDADYFFGREAEVEAVWKKMLRPRLLGLIGPSGTGKSSFVRAGLLAALPPTWAAVVATPGHRPFRSLAQALAPALAGDATAVQSLLRFEEGDAAVRLVSRWRQRHEHALIVVDQFEELFTLSSTETQASFAELLGRLVLEADVHVLVSLRDDFLFRCHAHDALSPILSELTLLGPLDASGLRRALVQPALACGYRLEDEALVEEMIEAVGSERGALPLLAFAASRLWEKRDRERGALTRGAYEEIGGVAGALAQHAEATLERIGTHRTPLVRELLRNLVTAQATRAVREREELLSVFPESDRSAADEVLSTLIDARLLTSFERAGDESGVSRQDIEIVHESLLSRWPRLVRWQTQDADGALLRDQLRQAAQLWQDRGQPEDLLWSGTAYQDLALWRQRYPGGLTRSEEAFSQAAARRASRRRRRRRMASAASVLVLSLGLGIVTLLWTRAEESRRKAEAEALRREAAQLVSLGRLDLEGRPMAALAHAIASLERIDNEPARRLAVEALWRGPTSFVVSDPASVYTPVWSADGRRLALGSPLELAVYDRGGQRHPIASSAEAPLGFNGDGSRLASIRLSGSRLSVWSVPEGDLLETRDLESSTRLAARAFDWKLLTQRVDPESRTIGVQPVEAGPERRLGAWRPGPFDAADLDPEARRVVWTTGGRILQQRLDDLAGAPRELGWHRAEGPVSVLSWKSQVVTSDSSGRVRLWNARSGGLERTLQSPASASRAYPDPRGRYLATSPGPAQDTPGSFVLFDLQAPRGGEPVALVNRAFTHLMYASIDPLGRWLASSHDGKLALWNLASRRAFVFHGQAPPHVAVAFTPDGRLLSTSDEGAVRLWRLFHEGGEDVRELLVTKRGPPESMIGGFAAVDAKGRAVVVNTNHGKIFALPLDGSAPSLHELESSVGRPILFGPSIDPAGRRLAFRYGELGGDPEAASIRILDLVSGAQHSFRAGSDLEGCPEAFGAQGFSDFTVWLPDGRLVTHGSTGLRVWDPATGTNRLVHRCRPGDEWVRALAATPDSKAVFSLAPAGSNSGPDSVSTLTRFDLETGTAQEVASHGRWLLALALDPSGNTLVTGSEDGVVRVGPISGEEPHLLYGHGQAVSSVAVSPDGHWIASASDDSIRIWPMPEGRPLHTLPFDELMAKLRAQTNLWIVPDPAAATGYSVERGRFPGWAESPEW